MIVLFLVNIAFVTLVERKILGCAQLRKGPNKVSLGGVLQPVADAIKLFFKETAIPRSRNISLFIAAPGMGLVFFWLCTRSLHGLRDSGFLEYVMVYVLCVLRVGVYPLYIAGWASNNKYAILGRLRGIAQSISYEISLRLIVLRLIILVQRFDFNA